MAVFSRLFSWALLVVTFASQAFAAGGANDDSYWKKDPSDWKVEILPVMVWAPIMGASVTLPQFPNLPNVPGTAGSDATGSLDGAAFAGFRVEKNRWSAEGNLLWAGLSAERSNPNLKIGLDIIYGQLMGGREILPGLFLEGGVRRMALDISAKLADYPEVSRKPGIWDPLVGMTYRKPLGKKWQLGLHGDGGGFGVGSDVSVAATARLDWRFAKHFGAAFGYGVLHFKVSDTVSQRTLTVDQTMHGPILGFGIYF